MRLAIIDIYKFLFSWIICAYHFCAVMKPREHFILGASGVELFVLIAGVFFFFKAENAESNFVSPYSYIKRRFLRFFPYTTTAFAFAAIVRCFTYVDSGKTLTAERLLKWFSGDIWEISLVSMNGLNNHY